MPILYRALLILALVCFVIAACGVATRINMLAAGLAFWVLEVLLKNG